MKNHALLLVIIIGFLTLSSCQSPSKSASEKPQKPNIVFVIADDLGWADIGYHGSSIQTPHLDRLAEGGITFDRHYVTPTCTPTRVGLMSGRYPSRYGVTAPAYGVIFGQDIDTLPAALGAVGYHSVICGKWHMGSPPDNTPLRNGFDSSYGYFHGQIDPYTHHYKTGIKSWHRNDEYLTESGHATDLISDEAVRVIESKQDQDRPFFLYVAYSVPHFPLDEPDQYLDLYPEIKEDSRRWYAASVTHMDEGIGKIVDALDRTGQRDNTLFVFVSDNGGQKSWHSRSQYHGRYADKPHTVLGDNRPLRGWKGDLYEGGIRVPAFVSWPKTLKPGKVSAPVHIVDWMPTLCRLTGSQSKGSAAWDGQDVWDSILNDKALPNRVMYWKTPNAFAVRRGPWKLIQFKQENRYELYQLEKDPYETTDRLNDNPEIVKELKILLGEIKQQDREKQLDQVQKN